MPDPTAMPCGHDPSEIRHDADGMAYCLRCMDISNIEVYSHFVDPDGYGERSIFLREIARLRAELAAMSDGARKDDIAFFALQAELAATQERLAASQIDRERCHC